MQSPTTVIAALELFLAASFPGLASFPGSLVIKQQKVGRSLGMRLAERIAALSSYASSFGRTMSFALIVYIVSSCG